MKRTYLVSREKVVYYRKEVVLDTDNWDQIYDLLEECDIDDDIDQWDNWAQVPSHVQQEVIEIFESTLDDEDITGDECYDTEEWCEGNDVELYQVEELEAAE